MQEPLTPTLKEKQELRSGQVVWLPLTSIVPGRFPVRVFSDRKTFLALKESIREEGLIHPVVVRPHPEKEKFGLYEIVCGERRFKAFQELSQEDPDRFSTIPCRVLSLNDESALRLILEENELREDWTPFERALFFHRVYKEGVFPSIRKMAEGLKMGVTTLHRYLRIFDLPQRMVKAFQEGRINLNQIEVLLEAPEKVRGELFERFVDHPMGKEVARYHLKLLLSGEEPLSEPPLDPGIPGVTVKLSRGEWVVQVRGKGVEEIEIRLDDFLQFLRRSLRKKTK